MLTEGDVMGKPSKGTKKDRRLKSNKSKKKRKGSGSAKKLNKKKSAAFNKILVY
jgi:hypothetical protein